MNDKDLQASHQLTDHCRNGQFLLQLLSFLVQTLKKSKNAHMRSAVMILVSLNLPSKLSLFQSLIKLLKFIMILIFFLYYGELKQNQNFSINKTL